MYSIDPTSGALPITRGLKEALIYYSGLEELVITIPIRRTETDSTFRVPSRFRSPQFDTDQFSKIQCDLRRLSLNGLTVFLRPTNPLSRISRTSWSARLGGSE